MSLPHLDVSRQDSGIGYSGTGSCNGIDQLVVPYHACQHGAAEFIVPYGGALAAELKQLLTLKQHYYPEGNWGWMVCWIATLVQLLTHGLQLSYGIQMHAVTLHFKESCYRAGKTNK